MVAPAPGRVVWWIENSKRDFARPVAPEMMRPERVQLYDTKRLQLVKDLFDMKEVKEGTGPVGKAMSTHRVYAIFDCEIAISAVVCCSFENCLQFLYVGTHPKHRGLKEGQLSYAQRLVADAQIDTEKPNWFAYATKQPAAIEFWKRQGHLVVDGGGLQSDINQVAAAMGPLDGYEPFRGCEMFCSENLGNLQRDERPERR